MSDFPKTAADLKAAVRSRHEPPEWLCEEELTLQGRRIDVVAFNLWAARGYRVCAFECKVARSDFLNELADYRKSEEWVHLCDGGFWLVTIPGVVKDIAEVPEGWGWLELKGDRMFTRRHAPRGKPSETMPRELASRLLTRMRVVEASERDRIRDEAWLAGEAHAKRMAATEAGRKEEVEQNVGKMRARLHLYESALGTHYADDATAIERLRRVTDFLRVLPARAGNLTQVLDRYVSTVRDTLTELEQQRDAIVAEAAAVAREATAP